MFNFSSFCCKNFILPIFFFPPFFATTSRTSISTKAPLLPHPTTRAPPTTASYIMGKKSKANPTKNVASPPTSPTSAIKKSTINKLQMIKKRTRGGDRHENPVMKLSVLKNTAINSFTSDVTPTGLLLMRWGRGLICTLWVLRIYEPNHGLTPSTLMWLIHILEEQILERMKVLRNREERQTKMAKLHKLQMMFGLLGDEDEEDFEEDEEGDEDEEYGM